MKNSLLVSLLTTGIALALGSAAAYAIARLSVPGGNTILLMTLATQMFPGIVIIIPLFLVLSRLRLIDTYAGLILVYLSFVLPIVIWILKGFFESIPPELEKAAAVDGASTLQTFTASCCRSHCRPSSPPASSPSSRAGTSSCSRSSSPG